MAFLIYRPNTRVVCVLCMNELLSDRCLTGDHGDDKVCENAVRVRRLRQECSELSIKVPHEITHDEGANKYAFILVDDAHKASHWCRSLIRYVTVNHRRCQFSIFFQFQVSI